MPPIYSCRCGSSSGWRGLYEAFGGLIGLFSAFGCGLHAQAAAAPVDVKVCDVVKSPASFDGKLVRIKGTVVAGFDEFIIKDATDPNCGYQVNGIWLSYPQGSKASPGPWRS